MSGQERKLLFFCVSSHTGYYFKNFFSSIFSFAGKGSCIDLPGSKVYVDVYKDHDAGRDIK